MKICKNCKSVLFNSEKSVTIKVDSKSYYMIEDNDPDQSQASFVKTEHVDHASKSKNAENKASQGWNKSEIMYSKNLMGGGTSKINKSGCLEGQAEPGKEISGNVSSLKIKEEYIDSQMEGKIKFFRLKDPEISKSFLSYDSFYMKVSFHF